MSIMTGSPAGALYDEIGRTYASTRRPDPRIARTIHAALGDARTVLNVGAGAGNYEPRDRLVIAVEPSAVMRAQRPPGAAPCLEASAEALPFPARTFDAAMAVLSDHHWADRAAGLRELARVARRVVVLGFDEDAIADSWLVRDYVPEFAALPRGFTVQEIAGHLGGADIVPVPIPHDCLDGFMHAWWRRPEAYLDRVVRDGISIFSQVGPEVIERFTAQLERDLASGAWRERNAALLDRYEIDLGYRLVIATLA
jgi:SAM-dependent methyltransferase